jgi:membrane associated rhomboid family serine protease
MADDVRISVGDATARLNLSRPSGNWRQKAFLIGGAAGAAFGLLAAYFYTRGAEETVRKTGAPASPESGEIIALMLAGMTMARQIAEMGRDSSKPKKK